MSPISPSESSNNSAAVLDKAMRTIRFNRKKLKNSGKRWRIPPSPEEVEVFDVVKIPSMYVLDMDGNHLGQIIENPPHGKSLERAILEILES